MRLRKRKGSQSYQKGSRRIKKRNPLPIRNALGTHKRSRNSTKGGTQMNNAYVVNQALQGLFQMRNAGRNPQQIMQMLIQRNPQYSQMLTQIRNMSQGRSTKEFVMQLARQNGVNDQNLQMLSQMFN